MAHYVLRRILEHIHSSQFLAVLGDEATDMSKREQLTLVVRWISDDFILSEELVDLYTLSSTDAQSNGDVIKDAFLQFQIPFAKLHGQ